MERLVAEHGVEPTLRFGSFEDGTQIGECVSTTRHKITIDRNLLAALGVEGLRQEAEEAIEQVLKHEYAHVLAHREHVLENGGSHLSDQWKRAIGATGAEDTGEGTFVAPRLSEFMARSKDEAR